MYLGKTKEKKLHLHNDFNNFFFCMFSQFSKKLLLNMILLKSELIMAFVLEIFNNRILAKR